MIFNSSHLDYYEEILRTVIWETKLKVMCIYNNSLGQSILDELDEWKVQVCSKNINQKKTTFRELNKVPKRE